MKRKARARGKAGEPQRVRFLTAKQVQAELGISERTFQRMVQDGLAAVVPGKGAKPALYDPIKVALYLRQSVDETGGEDELMSGPPGSSPWLEAYRKEKARAEKRRNDLAEQRIIDVADVQVMIDAIFDALSAELDVVCRLHGQKIGDDIRHAIARAQKKSAEVLPERQQLELEAMAAPPKEVAS